MGKDKGPKFQHHLAKFFIRPWAHDGHIIQFDKVTKQSKPLGLKKAAGEEYFYEFKGIADPELIQRRKTFENLLGDVDSRGAPVVKALRESSDPITFLSKPANHKALVQYLTYQFLRGPGTRAAIGDLGSPLAQKVARANLAPGEVLVLPSSKGSDPEETCDYENWKKLQQFKLTINGFKQVCASFLSMPLTILAIEPPVSSSFLLPDSGLGHNDELGFIFPVSPRMCILLGTKNQKKIQLKLCSENDVTEINGTLLAGAFRYVYCQHRDLTNTVQLAEAHPEWCCSEEEVMQAPVKGERLTDIWWLKDLTPKSS